MRQAADEAGLELNMDLPGPAQSTVGQTTQVQQIIFDSKLFQNYFNVVRHLWSRTSCHKDWRDSDKPRLKII